MERKGILEEIYDKAVEGSVYMERIEYAVNQQLDILLSVHRERLPEQMYTRLQEIVVSGAVVAEKVAFIEGVCYGMRLSKEIYPIDTDNR